MRNGKDVLDYLDLKVFTHTGEPSLAASRLAIEIGWTDWFEESLASASKLTTTRIMKKFGLMVQHTLRLEFTRNLEKVKLNLSFPSIFWLVHLS